MADKVDKPKKQKSKAKQDEKGVLAALPSTRPERIGARRGASAPAPKSTATTAASRAAKSTATAKPAAKQPARKAAAKPKPKPKPAAKPRTAAAAAPASEGRTYPRPRPVSEGAPGIGTGYRDEAGEESGRPGGTDLAATAVKAAGEVAQLGITVGGAVLKRVVKRLPKP